MSRLRLPVRLTSERITGTGAVALALCFTAFISAKGIPALRQDWAWPSSINQVHRFLLESWSGWTVAGMGAPVPYPDGYLIAVPLWILMLVVGAQASFVLFVLICGVVVGFSVRELARVAGSTPFASLGLIAFALFNPWVYTKVVAGHLMMVLAYGATFYLAALLLLPAPPWRRVALSLTVIFVQLQFFLISMVLVLLRLRTRGVLRAVVFASILFAPIAFGVAADWRPLSATPYTLAWQQNLSILPVQAFLLDGYFTHYSQHIQVAERIAVSSAIAAALLVLLLRDSSRMTRLQAAVIGSGACIAVLASTGTKGPLSGVYAYAVIHFPPTGLFRELYDLLGYAAVGYVALAAFAGRYRIASIFCGIAGAAAMAGWFVQTPSSFFVARNDIPKFEFLAPRNTRYALYPDLQPMSFLGNGSGVDPDAYQRGGNVTPLNSYSIQYPGAVAMERYAREGSTRMLGALSVSTIVRRPWMESDAGSLRAQLGAGFAGAAGRTSRLQFTRIPAMPELAVLSAAQVTALPAVPGSASVFFGDPGAAKIHGVDARAWPNFQPLHVAEVYADSDRGWVDAPLTFLAHLDAAQSLGGAATTSRATLPLNAGAVLTFVNGTLRNRGRVVRADHGRAYAWVSVDAPVELQCSGYCVVAGTAKTIPNVAAGSASARYLPVEFRQWTPWLLSAAIAPSGGLLRYNSTFGRAWLAFVDGRAVVPHMRLDGTVNAWALPFSQRRRTLLIVNVAAGVQFVLEIVGCVAAALVFGRGLYLRRNAPGRRTA